MRQLFLLALLPILLPAALGSKDGGAPPDFAPNYVVKAVLNIPYSEIREPMHVWFDSEAGMSRVDYYHGTSKTLQLPNMGKFGTAIKIVPITTEEVQNVRHCFQDNGPRPRKVEIQGILPNLSMFQFKGIELINGHHSEKWYFEKRAFDKVNKYTMYLRHKDTPNGRIPFPVRFEVMGINSLLGSHFDHFYFDYDTYSPEKPNPEVFEIYKNYTCTVFGDEVAKEEHSMSFNPLAEYMHGFEDHVDHYWSKFMSKHNRTYNEAENEHQRRRNIFRNNLRFIQSMNREALGFKLAINHLADRTAEELKALTGRRYTPGDHGDLPFPDMNHLTPLIPEIWDWRLGGAVSPVKDQSVCGSCWSFATTGAIEGAYFRKTGKLVHLSQQALVDCSWGFGNNGCDGGEDWRVYKWVMKHGGVPLDLEYGPYQAVDGYCHIDKVKPVANITGYVKLPPNNHEAMKIAIWKHGPVAVAIDASPRTFSFYSHGIYRDPLCRHRIQDLNHAVQVVGYGTIRDEPYYLVKNSWSNTWGNDGYILMSARGNTCGILTDASYVTM